MRRRAKQDVRLPGEAALALGQQHVNRVDALRAGRQGVASEAGGSQQVGGGRCGRRRRGAPGVNPCCGSPRWALPSTGRGLRFRGSGPCWGTPTNCGAGVAYLDQSPANVRLSLCIARALTIHSLISSSLTSKGRPLSRTHGNAASPATAASVGGAEGPIWPPASSCSCCSIAASRTPPKSRLVQSRYQPLPNPITASSHRPLERRPATVRGATRVERAQGSQCKRELLKVYLAQHVGVLITAMGRLPAGGQLSPGCRRCAPDRGALRSAAANMQAREGRAPLTWLYV